MKPQRNPINRFALVLAIIATLYSSPLFGQSNNRAVYVELLGNGIFYSVNYEHKVAEQTYVRVGGMYLGSVNTYPDGTASMFILPVMANYLVGKGNHHLELGVGFSINRVDGQLDFLEYNISDIGLTSTIGYRYQKSDPGLMFKAGLTPFSFDNTVHLWFGLGAGYAF